jgi:hypothetical protein
MNQFNIWNKIDIPVYNVIYTCAITVQVVATQSLFVLYSHAEHEHVLESVPDLLYIHTDDTASLYWSCHALLRYLILHNDLCTRFCQFDISLAFSAIASDLSITNNWVLGSTVNSYMIVSTVLLSILDTPMQESVTALP